MSEKQSWEIFGALSGMSKLSIAKEFVVFLRENKKTWIIPIVMMLLFLGVIIVVGQGSSLAPFIYAIF